MGEEPVCCVLRWWLRGISVGLASHLARDGVLWQERNGPAGTVRVPASPLKPEHVYLLVQVAHDGLQVNYELTLRQLIVRRLRRTHNGTKEPKRMLLTFIILVFLATVRIFEPSTGDRLSLVEWGSPLPLWQYSHRFRCWGSSLSQSIRSASTLGWGTTQLSPFCFSFLFCGFLSWSSRLCVGCCIGWCWVPFSLFSSTAIRRCAVPLHPAFHVSFASLFRLISLRKAASLFVTCCAPSSL